MTLDEAKQWVMDKLADGPVLADEVDGWIKENQIIARALYELASKHIIELNDDKLELVSQDSRGGA